MKVINRILIFFIFSSVFSVQDSFCSEDQEMDTLFAQLTRAEEDTSKVNILIKLAEKTSWSDIRSSEKYAKQALQLSQQINYEKGLAYSRFRLAVLFIDFDFKLTEELILESLEHAQHLNDSLLIAKIYNIIGNLKDKIGESDDALSYYNKSLQIFKDHNQDSLKAPVYNNLGIIYSNLSKDSLSEVYYLKAAEINSLIENHLGLAINYLNIGYGLIKAGKPEKGYIYLKQSLEIANDKDFPRILPWIYNNISYYYFKSHKYSEAISYAELGLELSKDQANLIQEKEALTHLKNTYFEKTDLLNAYKYSELVNIVIDSINTNNKLKELDLLEMRYKYEEDRKVQELELALLEAGYYKNELIYAFVILGSGLIIFIFVFLYFLQRNRIRRKNLEQKTTILEKDKLAKDLEFKNKELTTNVMYLLKKNEFISTISNKLKNVNLDSGKTDNNAIEKIIMELDKSIIDDNWEDFEVRFQEVHVGFYNKLSTQFPTLTPNELRLCAFLRLNMTSKEIADITYQSPESLKTARYRLRKKLELAREENLVAFLTKL